MIKINKLRKIYRGKDVETIALDNVSLEIKKHEFISIMGKSGSGKSTLLNILGCMDNFDEGEYIFEGVNIKTLNNKKLSQFRSKRIGFIFQAFNLINDMNVLENVEVPLGYAGVSSKSRIDIALELLKKVNMLDKVKSYPTQLSGGQQQRVAIARALSNSPDIILADEPTGNLDTQNGIDILNILSELNKNGTTIIMVTHDEKVADFSKRKIILEDGQIIKDTIA